MGIFLIAGFFVVSLVMAILMAIATFQQYAPSALESLTAYGQHNNDMQGQRSTVKIYQTPQAVISAKPKRKTAILSVITSAQSGKNEADSGDIDNIANLPIAA